MYIYILLSKSFISMGISLKNDPLLLTWINLNLSMVITSIIKCGLKLFIHSQTSTFNCIVEVWEWISNFISHFTGHVITYPCWDWPWYWLWRIHGSFSSNYSVHHDNEEWKKMWKYISVYKMDSVPQRLTIDFSSRSNVRRKPYKYCR